ncbi:MAG TPA: STAS domain-containing protein [Acidimicrobiales bacterium]|nr:STAS domain-containing protein [Acidimicrobiales bacterium]
MGLELSGEIDLSNAPQLAARLINYLEDVGDIVVDASRLTFIDVTGCRVLVEFADRLDDDRRIVIESAPRVLLRVMSLCGFAEHPKIAFRQRGKCDFFAPVILPEKSSRVRTSPGGASS